MAPVNPMQLAQHRWFDMCLAGNHFPVRGTRPSSLAFDGASLWVGNTGSRNVSRIRACDGAFMGLYPVPGTPVALAFDGGSVWVATRAPCTLTRLRAFAGGTAASYPLTPPDVGEEPTCMVFDGVCIWIGWTINTEGFLTRHRATDGAIQGAPIRQGMVLDLAFDGSQIWVAEGESSCVARLRASDGVQIGLTAMSAISTMPLALACDGSSMWAACFSFSGTGLARIDLASGTLTAEYPGNATALAFDGLNLWVASGSGLRKVRPSDGVVLAQHTFSGLGTAFAFDGAFLWATEPAANTLLKL